MIIHKKEQQKVNDARKFLTYMMSNKNRRTGRTTEMINCNTNETIYIFHTEREAKEWRTPDRRTYTWNDLISGKLFGMFKPVVIDHGVYEKVIGDLLSVIREMETQNPILEVRTKS